MLFGIKKKNPKSKYRKKKNPFGRPVGGGPDGACRFADSVPRADFESIESRNRFYIVLSKSGLGVRSRLRFIAVGTVFIRLASSTLLSEFAIRASIARFLLFARTTPRHKVATAAVRCERYKFTINKRQTTELKIILNRINSRANGFAIALVI